MLGKLKNAVKSYITNIVKQETAKNKTPKQKKVQKIIRDFGRDVSSMELKKNKALQMLNLSFQKSAKDFSVNLGADNHIAMDSYADSAKPAISFDGTAKDIAYTFFAKFGFIGWQLCGMLSQHWLISNACSIPAKDAIRNGWQNTFADQDKDIKEGSEEKNKEQKFLTELNEITNTKFKLSAKAIQWITKYNIYGIGIALPIVEGIDLEKPFNIDGVKKGSFKGLSIIDPYWLTPEFDMEVMSDPTHPDFYTPTWYRTANGQKIHKSHFIIIRRKEVPDILKPSYYFGGIPLTQEIYERVYASEKSANEQPLLLLTKRLNTWKIDLNEFFLDPEKYEERLNNFTEKRDNQGVLLIDHEDELGQTDTSLSDLDQVVMSQYKLVSAVARIPVDKLFELNPSGSLSNNGDYNIKNYNQDLNTMQNDLFKPLIDRVNELTMRSYYDRQDRISIVFNPTDNPTANELAESVKTEVETLQSLIGSNVITTDEARQKLIANKTNGFSFLDEEAPEQEDNSDIEQMLAQAKGGQQQMQNKAQKQVPQTNTPKAPQQAKKQPVPQAQSKDSAIAEDDRWITIHPPRSNKEDKGVPLLLKDGQTPKEALNEKINKANNGGTKTEAPMISKVVNYAKKNGYDGVIARNINDYGGMGDGHYVPEYNDDYIVFNPKEQIKSVENNGQWKGTTIYDEAVVQDTDWITVHPKGHTKGQHVPVEEGQNKGEAIKQHFERASAGESDMYNDNDDDFDDSFNPEAIEEQAELEQANKQLAKEEKAKNRRSKKEQEKWEQMSEEEQEEVANKWREAEEKENKDTKKTLPEQKQLLSDMGISRIQKPKPTDDRWKEYSDLSPRIKRYFFTDREGALKWDEAQDLLQKHKGNDTEDIFEYLRMVDVTTPQSRTNERTRNYLKGTSEDSDWKEEDHNRDERGRFAVKAGINTPAETDITLNVPYEEKEEAKALGAKWNPQIKKWYIPKGIHNEQFIKWYKEQAEENGTITEFNKEIPQQKTIIKQLADGFNVTKETKKAYLVEKDGIDFWIQKRWVRENGTLTPAGLKSYDEAVQIGGITNAKNKAIEKHKAHIENLEKNGVKFHKVWESEKAVATDVIYTFYSAVTEDFEDYKIRVFIPKSLLNDKGNAPYWFVKQKLEEAQSQANLRAGNHSISGYGDAQLTYGFEFFNNDTKENNSTEDKAINEIDTPLLTIIDGILYEIKKDKTAFESNIKIGENKYRIILHTEQYKGEKENKPQTVHQMEKVK